MIGSFPVAIVGAGPAGMTAALDLAHYGVPSLLLDEDTLHVEGSRAIAYHSSALAVWEKVGAGKAMLDKGIAWPCRHTYFRDREVYVQNFPPPRPGELPSFLNLQQYYVERFLLDCIEAQPLIDLRWNHKVTGLGQVPDSVTLDVDTPSGLLQVSASYILACDGARSTVRRLLDLDFPGRSFDDRFLIADVRASLDLPPEPRFYFNHPAHPGPTVLIHPQPDGVWRIDWQIGSGVDVAYERSPERMDARIRAFIGDVPYELVWLSDYRFHQRLLSHLRHGRIFFAGDSAHLVAPFGARGLNSAVQDVENLSWKLALLLQGRASESLLETYNTERWAAQAENQRITINTMKFMAPSTSWGRFRRQFVLRLASFLPVARRWVDSGRMSRPFVYRHSPLTLPDDPADSRWIDAPVPGEKISDRPLSAWLDGRCMDVRLRHLTGSGFLVLYLALDKVIAEQFVSQFVPPSEPIPFKVVPIFDGFPSLPFGAALLLRPDGHLAARRLSPPSASLSALITRLCRLD
jgi:3-(3-hydroxy-phenyl)propionate hydroxylase